MYAELVLNERPIGAMDVPADWIRSFAQGRLRSLAFYSLQSAQVWARVVIPELDGWVTIMSESPSDAPYHYGGVPGSLVALHNSRVPVGFPKELLEREFFLHLTYARNYLSWPNPLDAKFS